MTRQAATQAAKQTSTAHPLSSRLLQRKCESCGKHGVGGGKCGTCQKQESFLQNGNQQETQIQRKSDPPSAQSGFNHEFSRVPISTTVPRIQPKLRVSQPNDKYEQEADRIADQVMRIPGSVEQQMGTEKDEGTLHLKRESSTAPEFTPSFNVGLTNLRQSGTVLSDSTRAFMEPRFRHNFNNVRIHTSSQATNFSRSINARAFTVGHDIFFNHGEFQPTTPSGMRLLAHELTHTIQEGQTHVLRRKVKNHDEEQLQLERLPDDRETFLEIVNDIANNEVNLPSIFKSFWSKNPEYEKKIEYKPINRAAQVNFFDHLRKIEESISKAKVRGEQPPWLKDVNTQLSQPGAENIDFYLALAIALREGGSHMYSSSSDLLSTGGQAGLDNTYRNRNQLVKEGLIPDEWAESMVEDPKWKGAAQVPESRFLALTFATVGRTQNILGEEVGSIMFGDISDPDKRLDTASNLIDNLTPLARRIWIGVSFGGIGYLQNMLGYFHELGLPLDAITDIPNAVKNITPKNKAQNKAIQRLLRFTDIKRSKKLNVHTKTAIVAEAFERSNETGMETDIRTAPFLFGVVD